MTIALEVFIDRQITESPLAGGLLLLLAHPSVVPDLQDRPADDFIFLADDALSSSTAAKLRSAAVVCRQWKVVYVPTGDRNHWLTAEADVVIQLEPRTAILRKVRGDSHPLLNNPVNITF